MIATATPTLPRQSLWLFNWFRRYCHRYAAKNFHAVRLSRASPVVPSTTGLPLMFVMNHPSWWDIIVALLLSDRFKSYRHFAPIETAMLSKYRFFARLGFFGVDSTPRGAVQFLRTAKLIFEQPNRALWITAQGKFVDPRQRPIELKSGVGHVASQLTEGFIVPVAIEYPFWEERTPEMLIRFGEPLELRPDRDIDSREWTRMIEGALTAAQDNLAREAMNRDPSAFETLVAGHVGVGGVYDWWRRLKSYYRGRKFEAAHSSMAVAAKTRGVSE